VNVFAAAADAVRTGRRAALATVVGVAGSAPRHGGARMLVYEDGSLVGTIGGGALEHRVVALALEVVAAGRPQRFEAHTVRDLGMCCGGRVEVYVEPLQVRIPIVVFGAGHVAHALAPLLHGLDFDVTIVDDRTELNTPERFPQSTRHLGDPRAFAEALGAAPDAYRLVVTHDHALDQDLVATLLPREAAWLGMIGSRGKVARFLVRYRAMGMDPHLFSRLRAPVGLDLGAETPAEIAVSIAAELVQVRRGSDRSAVPLSSLPLKAREP
jgi:xanthine dehydrogenase accessory factor